MPPTNWGFKIFGVLFVMLLSLIYIFIVLMKQIKNDRVFVMGQLRTRYRNNVVAFITK